MQREIPVRHRVVVVGGGFGGLTAAQHLDGTATEVVLVDRRNHHLFQPLLYQVATAGLNPSDIATPIRRILRHQRNTRVLLGEVVSFDTAKRRVILHDGELEYDSLVVATGVTHSYFGKNHWERFAPGLKTVEDALEMRRRIFLAFEAAEREADEAKREEWMTFVIVGAGPTGVELAGALAEISRLSLSSDFRSIDPTRARILLMEGGARILPSFAPELSERAMRDLTEMGVSVRTATMVEEVRADGVVIAGERLGARTILWAAGVTASPLGRALGAPVDRAGRVPVNPDLSVPGLEGVYVIGDLAALSQDGQPLPGVAPVALQQGAHVARVILARMSGRRVPAFRYVDKGSMATIGRASAVAEIQGWRFTGLIAWLVWSLVHVVFLIGFRNRLLVLMEWTWAYFFFERGARLITGSTAAPATAERRATEVAATQSSSSSSDRA